MIDLTKGWTGDDVQQLCDQHGLSQRKLASMLGLRPSTVNDWATGKSAPSRLASIALTYVALDLAGELFVRKKKH
jgi:DNA-binding transcriptional regulator YiaG